MASMFVLFACFDNGNSNQDDDGDNIPQLVSLTAVYTGGNIVVGNKINGAKIELTLTYDNENTQVLSPLASGVSYWYQGQQIQDPVNYVFNVVCEMTIEVRYQSLSANMTVNVVGYTVTFRANGGTGTMFAVENIYGNYTLPENEFTAPQGMKFRCWAVSGQEKQVGETVVINANTNIDAVWEDYPQTQEEIDFLQFINDYQKLENLSKEYNSSGYQKRVLVYIRSSKYSSTQWNMLGGSLDSNFVTYVHEHDSSVEYLRTKEILTYPNSTNQIDFVHMIATLNLVMTGDNNSADLGGWGGDLCQLVSDLKTTDKTGAELKDFVLTKFNQNSSFGAQDVVADLDAVNIYNIYKNQSEKSFAKAMKDYYRNITESARKTSFAEYLFQGQNLSTTQQKVDYLLSRLSNNFYIVYLNSTYGISFENNEELFNTCLTVFVEYLCN